MDNIFILHDEIGDDIVDLYRELSYKINEHRSSVIEKAMLEQTSSDDLMSSLLEVNELYLEAKEGIIAKFKEWIKKIINAILGRNNLEKKLPSNTMVPIDGNIKKKISTTNSIGMKLKKIIFSNGMKKAINVSGKVIGIGAGVATVASISKHGGEKEGFVKGRKVGYKEGNRDGEITGYNKGLVDGENSSDNSKEKRGYDRGRSEGFTDGYKTGKSQSNAEGKMIGKKYGYLQSELNKIISEMDKNINDIKKKEPSLVKLKSSELEEYLKNLDDIAKDISKQIEEIEFGLDSNELSEIRSVLSLYLKNIDDLKKEINNAYTRASAQASKEEISSGASIHDLDNKSNINPEKEYNDMKKMWDGLKKRRLERLDHTIKRMERSVNDFDKAIYQKIKSNLENIRDNLAKKNIDTSYFDKKIKEYNRDPKKEKKLGEEIVEKMDNYANIMSEIRSICDITYDNIISKSFKTNSQEISKFMKRIDSCKNSLSSL